MTDNIKASDSILERVRNLLRTIDENSGATDNERDNAQTLLDRLLDKYQLSLDDFETQTRKRRKFSYNSRFESKLLSHIVMKVLGVSAINFNKAKKGKRSYFDLTDAEYADVCQLYELYRPALQEAIDDAFAAFMTVNGLFETVYVDDDVILTDEQVAQMRRRRKYKEAIRRLPNPAIRQLGDAEDDEPDYLPD